MKTSLSQSFALHFFFLILFGAVWWFYREPRGKVVKFQVIEKFKVSSESKAKPVQINRPQPKNQASKPKKRKVFGVSRKSQTSESSGVEVKLGNTLAKTPDDLKLKKDDDESLPIPAEEFLITSMPAVLEEVRPQYPESAKKRGIQGNVIFEILIDETGRVRKAEIIKALDPELDEAALRAIRSFRFRAAQIENQPVAVKIKYAINFVLENS